MSALPPNVRRRNKCPLSANNIQGLLGSSLEFRGTHSAGQDNPDFGELAELCIDLDRARMLLNNNVMADGEAKTSFVLHHRGKEK